MIEQINTINSAWQYKTKEKCGVNIRSYIGSFDLDPFRRDLEVYRFRILIFQERKLEKHI